MFFAKKSLGCNIFREIDMLRACAASKREGSTNGAETQIARAAQHRWIRRSAEPRTVAHQAKAVCKEKTTQQKKRKKKQPQLQQPQEITGNL